jgi:AcrR family transcriptional regulator
MDSKQRVRRTRSEVTRARILDAALALFNEHGTGPVSTNHIAERAGLSPGNLYYHFADKKEIIRELHARYAAGYEDRWVPEPDGPANLVKLRRNLADGAALAWEYRFLEREILSLLRADPVLRADYRRVYRRRLAEWTAFGERLVELGMVRAPRPPLRAADLSLAIWLIAQNWSGFLDATGGADDPARIAQGGDLVLAVIEPYLAPAARRAIDDAADPTPSTPDLTQSTADTPPPGGRDETTGAEEASREH